MDQTYEIIFITDKKEEVFKKILDNVKELLNKLKASITTEDDMGVRKLAYEIDKQREGHYYLILFTAQPQSIVSLEKQLKLNENIIRYMIVKKS